MSPNNNKIKVFKPKQPGNFTKQSSPFTIRSEQNDDDSSSTHSMPQKKFEVFSLLTASKKELDPPEEEKEKLENLEVRPKLKRRLK